MDIELETELKPFIPDYIPAIGDIDAFIKVCHQMSLVYFCPKAYYSDDCRFPVQTKNQTNLVFVS